MPTVLRIRGYRFFFISDESREPAHVHVESGDNYAKFWPNPVGLASSASYNAVEIRALRELVEEHRAHFLERWNEHFRQSRSRG